MTTTFTRDSDGAKFEINEISRSTGGIPSSVVTIRPIPTVPKRWRAEEGERYYWINEDGDARNSRESGDEIDDARHAYGNYFKDDSVIPAVATAIQKLLKYVHTPIESIRDDGVPLQKGNDYEQGNYIKLADEARKVVWSEEQV